MAASTTSSRPPRSSVPRRLLGGAVRCGQKALAVVGLFFLVYHGAFDLSVIMSPSMAPTLQGTCAEDGDRVLTERVTYRLRGPRRWELVSFYNRDGVQIMKRVVGLPGEEIALRDGQFFVNGAPVAVPAELQDREYLAYGKLRRGRPTECKDGYFVMGDDSKDSQDSRYEDPLTRDRITGRPWLIVWPPKRAGAVNPSTDSAQTPGNAILANAG